MCTTTDRLSLQDHTVYTTSLKLHEFFGLLHCIRLQNFYFLNVLEPAMAWDIKVQECTTYDVDFLSFLIFCLL